MDNRFRKKTRKTYVQGTNEFNKSSNMVNGISLTNVAKPGNVSGQKTQNGNKSLTSVNQNYVKSYSAYKATNNSSSYTTPVYAYKAPYIRSHVCLLYRKPSRIRQQH